MRRATQGHVNSIPQSCLLLYFLRYKMQLEGYGADRSTCSLPVTGPGRRRLSNSPGWHCSILTSALLGWLVLPKDMDYLTPLSSFCDPAKNGACGLEKEQHAKDRCQPQMQSQQALVGNAGLRPARLEIPGPL